MPTPCLVVLTARGPARLASDRGSQAWRLNRDNALRVRYCVCVQNRHNGHWGGADQEHHSAFLVGRISDVVPSPERADRFLVMFSEYARINHLHAWNGMRNPVRYASLEDFGIDDVSSLEWLPIPAGNSSDVLPVIVDEEAGTGPLTIPEAKAGLSLGLGVPETAIEITVRY